MSTSPIKRVALAGASGNLGPAILNALLAADFDVTVLTRKDSKSTFPSASNLTITPVDYESAESLTTALHGQDALVSTLASLALPVQFRLFDAAAAAGVRRLIPSEFGSNTTISPNNGLPVFGHKVKMQKHLAELAAKDSNVSYTLIINGAFFDCKVFHQYGVAFSLGANLLLKFGFHNSNKSLTDFRRGMQVGFIVNIKGRSVQLYDGGNRPFSVTTLPTVGKAVVGSLQHPSETANRAVKVHEAIVTQNQLVSIAEKLSGDTFAKTDFDTKEAETRAYEALKKGDYSVMVDFIKRAIWGEGYGGEFDKVDNDLLGIKTLNDNEVEEVVAKYI